MSSMPMLGGRYRLLNRLGRGGMSVVWRGYDQLLGRPVAIKLLASDAAGAAGRELVLAEARTAAQLSHPHICQIYDYGESQPESGDHVAYIVMELLSGSTLAERLQAGPMPVRMALRVCAQLASALAAAHSCGLVHRDIKPANVMMTPAGPKLVDFGIAAVAGAPDQPWSDGEMLGTPAYLAPERLTDGKVKPESDVYALGIVLYRMVSGTVPWPAETVTELLDAHRHRPPAPLPPLAGLPATAAQLCQRCLAKDPRQRPTAAELARRLAETIGWRVSPTGVELIEVDDGPAAPDPHEPPQHAATAEAWPGPPAAAPAGSDKDGRTPRPLALRRPRRRVVLLAAAMVLAATVLVTGNLGTADNPADRHDSDVAAPPGTPATTPAGGRSPVTDQRPTGPTGAAGGGPREAPGDADTGAGIPPAGTGDRGPSSPDTAAPEPSPEASGVPEQPELDPAEEVVETPGGTVLARCARNTASVEPLELAPGYRVVDETRGPGVVRAGIVLGSTDSEVRIDVQCRAGRPVSTVDVA